MSKKLSQFVNNIGALNEDQKEATFALLNDCGVTFESLDSLDKDDLKTIGVPFPVWKPLLAAIVNPVSGGNTTFYICFERLIRLNTVVKYKLVIYSVFYICNRYQHTDLIIH